MDFLAGKVREVCAAALDSPPEVNNLLTELRTGLSPPPASPPPSLCNSVTMKVSVDIVLKLQSIFGI